MEQKQAIADRLKQSNNILVTVSNNPSVDQLASCIGLTLALNKLGKHATAVFSGNVPSTIEFLQPEKTLEKNTDSLRDFIIALDKSKADKLRYKVEDKVVKIFITPYKTSISDKDLDFSQGDFNVDVVVAIGVHQQNELDQAIIAHGRILHDAVVTTINTKPGGELGTINWLDPSASSLSELVVQLLDSVDNQIMDGQMATALLTGIVAETERFSNEKTTPATMSTSAELMGFGANQQLVATKLEASAPAPAAVPAQPATPVHDQGASLQGDRGEPAAHADDGTLEITHPSQGAFPNDAPPPVDHQEAGHPEEKQEHPTHPPEPVWEPEQEQPPEPKPEPAEEPIPQIHIDEHGSLHDLPGSNDLAQAGEDQLPPLPPVGGSTDPTQHMASSHTFLQPLAGHERLSDNPLSGADEASSDPLSLPQPESDAFGGFGSSPASANIAAPNMPYLPPSMTPGGTLDVPPPAAPPQIVHPGSTPAASEPQLPPLPAAPAPASIISPAPMAPEPAFPPLAPAAPAPPSETLSEIEADVNSPHLQEATPPYAPPAPMIPNPPTVAPTIQPPAGTPFAPLSTPVSSPSPNPGPNPSPAPFSAASALPPLAPAQPDPAPVAGPAPSQDLASARDAVMQAIASQAQPPVGPEPDQALNALPLGAPLHDAQPPVAAPAPLAQVNLDAASNPTFTLPDLEPTQSAAAPPSMPPPMVPPTSQQ